MGAKNDARNVAVATINLTMNKKNRRYEKDISGELINMNEYNADQSFMTKFTPPSFHEAQQWADFKVTELGGRLVASQSLFGDAAFIDIIHQLQLSLTDADISFTSPQTFNLTIEPGRLTVKDMFKFIVTKTSSIPSPSQVKRSRTFLNIRQAFGSIKWIAATIITLFKWMLTARL